MRAYVLVTGIVFALLTIAHIWRGMVERNVLTDPWFDLITTASAVLCIWAMTLLWRTPRASS